MNRRETVVALAALGAAVRPLFAFAQVSANVRRVGYLASGTRPESLDTGTTGAFRKGMRDLGYEEGKNVQYEWRFFDGKAASITELAAELLRLKVDVLVTGGTVATRAAQSSTKVTPIVMAFVGDPVGSGLVSSLARPGANITGVSNINVELNPKRIEMLAEIRPGLSRIGALLNPANPTYPLNLATMRAAAKKSNVTLLPFDAQTPGDIDRAFSTMRQQHVQALIAQTDSNFIVNARQVAELATNLRLPVIGPRQIVEHGGLMSYVPDQESAFRRAATYVDKILKGAKPADLPVEQPTKIELVINIKAAKAIGVSVPRELMFRADRVIE